MARKPDVHRRCREIARERHFMWAKADSRRYQAVNLLNRFREAADLLGAPIETYPQLMNGLRALARANKAATKAMPRLTYGRFIT